MPRLARRLLNRSLAIAVVLTTLASFGLSGFRGATPPARAEPADRIAVVLRFLAAADSGDLDTAAAQFADSAIFIGTNPTGNCSTQAPCTDVAGIRQQIQNGIDAHSCSKILWIQVSGAVVTGEREIRNDRTRSKGVDRIVQVFMALVPGDQITFFAARLDSADPDTALNDAINADTQPTGTPLPAPTAPCPEQA